MQKTHKNDQYDNSYNTCEYEASSNPYSLFAHQAEHVFAAKNKAHLLCFKSMLQPSVISVFKALIKHQNIIDHLAMSKVYFDRLLDQLNVICLPTFCLEINVSRLQKSKPSDDSTQRFNDYIQTFQKPAQSKAFFQEYPVLYDLLTQCITQWAVNCTQFIQRLAGDYSLIENHYKLDLGRLCHIGQKSGDTHNKGQQVLVCEFSSGFKLVYKPRSMAIDEQYQKAIRSLNSALGKTIFKPIQVINKGDYGWAEFIPYIPCDDHNGIARYYSRLGYHMALLNALQASDFHHENWIINGEFPVLIDLETISQIRPGSIKGSHVSTLNSSHVPLLNTGVLPHKIQLNSTNRIDVSVLGSNQQLVKTQQLKLVNAKTDFMQLQEHDKTFSLNEVQPKLINSDQLVKHVDYLPQIIKGYQQFNDFLIANQPWFIHHMVNPISDNHDIRCVFRPTAHYCQILQNSYHPDFMRSHKARNHYFDGLLKYTAKTRYVKRLICSEKKDLQQGDVPIFSYRLNDTYVADSQGVKMDDFLCTSPKKTLIKHIQSISKHTTERELWLIKATFSAQCLDDKRNPNKWLKGNAHKHNHKGHTPLEERINQQLCSLVYEKKSQVNWLDIKYSDGHWLVGFADFDLYDGLAGISLYFNCYAKYRNHDKSKQLATLLNNQIKQLIHSQDMTLNYSAFNGQFGLLYLTGKLKQLEIADFDQELDQLLKKAKDYTPYGHDIIEGAAGQLLVLCLLYHLEPTTSLRSMALKCANQLSQSSVKTDHGIGWINPSYQTKPTSGFAHGNSGVAYALAKYTSTFKDTSFIPVIAASLAHERSLYDSLQFNWADHRSEVDSSNMVAWCNGAIGVGLAAVEINRLLPGYAKEWNLKSTIKLTCDIAINHISKTNNDSLCHGSFGSLAFLYEVSKNHADVLTPQAYSDIKTTTLEQAYQEHPKSGLPKITTTVPGLMKGLAGMGLELLRQEHEKNTPNVLTLS